MAGKALSSGRFTDSAAQPASSGASFMRRMLQSDIAREIVALALLLAVVFLVLSMVSFDAADISGAVWPSNESSDAGQVSNLGGRIGASIVGTSYFYLGVSSFLLVALFGVWAGIIFLRRNLAAWPLKMVGAVLAVSAFAGFFGATASGSLSMPTSGGIVGAWIHGVLATNCGLTGAYLILSFVVAVSILLATDVLFYPMIRDLFRGGSNPADEAEAEAYFDPASGDAALVVSATGTSAVRTPGVGDKVLRFLGLRRNPTIPEPSAESVALLAVGSVHTDSTPMDVVVTLETNGAVKPTETATVARSTATVTAAAAKPAPAAKPRKAASASEPTLSLEELAKQYTLPEPELLDVSKKADPAKAMQEIEANKGLIVGTLRHFKIEAEVIDVRRGPTVSMYEIRIPHGMPIKRVIGRDMELSIMLQVEKIRVIPIAQRGTIGIEVPNRVRDTVSLREVVKSKEFAEASKTMALPIALGLDSEGKPMIRDLVKTPHLLIAGTTGSGKSVIQNVVLLSMLLSRHWQDVRFLLVDPKAVELTPYQDLGFLACPVISDSSKAVAAFEWLVEEMERRYSLLANTRTKKITEFNELSVKERRTRYAERGGDPEDIPERLPYIVAMVDELADLMMVNADTRMDELICRVAQKARAAGIHLILATQRPSADVVTGLIKANIPARIGFKLPTQVDSRTIINATGAEKLLGMGDMLVDWNDGHGLGRAQSAFCDTKEIERICTAVRSQTKTDYFVDPGKRAINADEEMIGGQPKHERFDEAVEQVLSTGRASAQMLRSALRIGYSAATTLILQMELAGILGPARGSKEREILVTMDEWQNRNSANEDEEQESVGSESNDD